MGKKVYPCPLCGRSVGRHGDPFEEPHKTQAHINGSHDGQHKGEVGESYVEEIEANAVEKAEMQVDEREAGGSEPSDASEIMVEVPLGPDDTDEMDLESALGVYGSAVFEPEEFGHTPLQEHETLDGRVDDIEGEVDQLVKQVEELREAIDMLIEQELVAFELDWEHFSDPDSDPFEP